MLPRVKTGMAGLDDTIQGGFPTGSTITVTGDSGAGKSTFAMQFIHNGITQSNEPGLYISFEEEKNRVYEYMKAYGWDFAQLEKDKKFVYLEYPPQDVDHFMAQELMVHDMIDEFGIKRVALDSITSFAMLYESEQKRKQEVVKLLTKLRKWGCTVILVAESHVDASGVPRAKYGMESLSDGVVYLYNFRKGGDTRVRALEVVKLRGTAYEARMFPLRFTSKGIEIFPDEHVY